MLAPRRSLSPTAISRPLLTLSTAYRKPRPLPAKSSDRLGRCASDGGTNFLVARLLGQRRSRAKALTVATYNVNGVNGRILVGKASWTDDTAPVTSSSRLSK